MTKEEAIRKLQKQKAEYLDEWVDFSGIAEAYDMAIEALSAERTGKWIDTGSGTECSECHEIMYGYDNYRNFCQNCGADMRGEKDA